MGKAPIHYKPILLISAAKLKKPGMDTLIKHRRVNGNGSIQQLHATNIRDGMTVTQMELLEKIVVQYMVKRVNG